MKSHFNTWVRSRTSSNVVDLFLTAIWRLDWGKGLRLETDELGVRWRRGSAGGIKDLQEGGDYLGGRTNRTWQPADTEWEVSLSRGGCLGSWMGHQGGRANIAEGRNAGGTVRGRRAQRSRSIVGAMTREPVNFWLRRSSRHGECWRELLARNRDPGTSSNGKPMLTIEVTCKYRGLNYLGRFRAPAW